MSGVVKFMIYKLGILFTEITTSVLYLISYTFLPFTRAVVTKILNESDIQVNGSRRSDPKVVDNRFYCLVAKYGYTGFVDAFANGYFECSDLSEFLTKIHRSKHYKWLCTHPSVMWRSYFTRHFYVQTSLSRKTGKQCTDGLWNIESNEDEMVTMSTGYWKQAITYDDSIKAKHDLIARKMKLKSGMRVLDLGCGEGPLCKYLAENNDVEVTGVDHSKAMIEKAQKFSRGLKINYKVMDARRITGKYDRITCIGLIEHFGASELRRFFQTVHRCLADNGIFVLEAYSTNHSYQPTNDGLTERICNLFVDHQYYLDLMKSIEGLFIIEDWQNLRKHASITVQHWLNKIDSNFDELVVKSGKKTIRQMKALYSENYSIGVSGQLQVYQIVFSKNGFKDGYDTVV